MRRWNTLLSHKFLYSDHTEDNARRERIKKDNLKRDIEAALFNARRILSVNEICKIIPHNQEQEVIKLTRELSNDYKKSNTALEIIEFSDLRFELKIKDDILNSIGRFTQGDLLSKSEVKTLAVITYVQSCATRKNLYAIRGRSKTIYNNIERLKKLKFITEKNKY